MSHVKEVEIPCEVRKETEKALLIYDGKQEVWVPKSQITDYGQDRNNLTNSIFLPQWLAEAKGLV